MHTLVHYFCDGTKNRDLIWVILVNFLYIWGLRLASSWQKASNPQLVCYKIAHKHGRCVWMSLTNNKKDWNLINKWTKTYKRTIYMLIHALPHLRNGEQVQDHNIYGNIPMEYRTIIFFLLSIDQLELHFLM